MWQFIISGYIPGTNYQLGFDSVAIASGFIMMIILIRPLIEEQIIANQQKHHNIQAKTI